MTDISILTASGQRIAAIVDQIKTVRQQLQADAAGHEAEKTALAEKHAQELAEMTARHAMTATDLAALDAGYTDFLSTVRALPEHLA